MRSTASKEKAVLLMSSVERTFSSPSLYWSQNCITIMPQRCEQLNTPAGAIPQEAMPAAA
jgi:hypothetical protein